MVNCQCQEYCLQKPEEVLQNKMGINFDLVELEREILSKRDVDGFIFDSFVIGVCYRRVSG